MNRNAANEVKSLFHEMMFIFGLKIGETSNKEKQEIESMIKKRNELRTQKRFTEADKIRKQLKVIGIELIDHKRRTVWKKLT